VRSGAGVDLGVQIFPGDPRRLVEEASMVEGLGFSSVWVADHFFGGGRDRSWHVPEVISVLGAVARATSRVRMGTCVLSLQKRDPATVAHAALTLNSLSEGRFELGLGTGFGPDLRAFGVDLRAPVGRFEEGLSVILRLFQASEERPATFDGTWFQLEDAFLNVPGPAPPPISIAAVGPRMLDLTARHADGWLPFGLTPEIYREFLASMGALRSPFVPGLWLPVFLERPGEDRSAEAEATGRLYLSMAPDVLTRAMPGRRRARGPAGATGWSADAAKDAADSIPADVARSVTLHGSPDDCIETLAAFTDAGCRRFVLRITDPDARLPDVRLLAETVLPAVSTPA
jgi:phthiodiolone/phenolphthiodiolone dimycocerosates ketoreductase